MRRRRLGETEAVVTMRRPRGFGRGVPSRQQLRGGVVADAFEQSVPVVGVVELDQALLDERDEFVQCPDVLLVAADGFGALEVKAAGEYGEALEQFLLAWIEQVVGPVDQCLEGLVPRKCGAASACEKSETPIEAFLDLVDPDGANSCRRELDR